MNKIMVHVCMATNKLTMTSKILCKKCKNHKESISITAPEKELRKWVGKSMTEEEIKALKAKK